jgi:DNA-binding transcriptional ArsR family regulator
MTCIELPETVDLDATFGALADELRRQTIDALTEQGSVPVETLAQAVADGDGDAATRTHVRMKHEVVPTLADAGLVERHTRRVKLTAEGKAVACVLDSIRDELAGGDQ